MLALSTETALKCAVVAQSASALAQILRDIASAISELPLLHYVESPHSCVAGRGSWNALQEICANKVLSGRGDNLALPP